VILVACRGLWAQEAEIDVKEGPAYRAAEQVRGEIESLRLFDPGKRKEAREDLEMIRLYTDDLALKSHIDNVLFLDTFDEFFDVSRGFFFSRLDDGDLYSKWYRWIDSQYWDAGFGQVLQGSSNGDLIRRMVSGRVTRITTVAYHRALDERTRQLSAEDLDTLRLMIARDGYSAGYLLSLNDSDALNKARQLFYDLMDETRGKIVKDRSDFRSFLNETSVAWALVGKDLVQLTAAANATEVWSGHRLLLSSFTSGRLQRLTSLPQEIRLAVLGEVLHRSENLSYGEPGKLKLGGEVDELLDQAGATSMAWSRIGKDLLEVSGRYGRGEAPEAIWSAHRTLLSALTSKHLEHLASLPKELRLATLQRLSREKGPKGYSSAQIDKVFAQVSQAVEQLGGDLYPEFAEAIARKLGGSVVSVDSMRRHSARYVRVRRSNGRAAAVRLPRWEFFGLERSQVAKRFSEAIGNPRKEEPVLFVGGDSDYMSRELLPDHLTARTFDRSLRFTDRHVENLQAIAGRAIQAKDVAFFNFLPKTREEVDAFDSRGSYTQWMAFQRRFEVVGEGLGTKPQDGTRDSLLQELQRGERDVIVVVAHGTPDAIYTNTGEALTRDDILNLPPVPEGRARPLVILLSCRTGEVQDGSRAVAQALLYRGYASAVVAPTKYIAPSQGLVDFLRALTSGRTLDRVLRGRPPELELWVSLPGSDPLDLRQDRNRAQEDPAIWGVSLT
jgi:hypothetical protein